MTSHFSEPFNSLDQRFVNVWIGTGVAWMLTIGWGLRHSTQPTIAVAFLVSAPLMSLAIAYDVNYRVLPRRLSHITLAAMLPFVLVSSGPGRTGAITGAVAMLAMTLVVDSLAGGVLGRGDVHFSPVIGLAVGWFEPRQVLTVWMVAAGIAAVVSAVDRRRESMVPYGPLFMVGASVAIVLAT